MARLARVSTATVSRVLNGGQVRPQTQQHVLDAIRKLSYEPNVLARNLRQGETKIIVVLLPDITNPFFSGILKGMEDVAQERGYNVLVCNTDNRLERELTYIRLLHQRRADGAIFLSARVDSKHIVQLSEQVPVVLACEYMEGLDIPQVSIDNVTSAMQATGHLAGLGHTRIAFVNGPLGIVLCRDRLKGYRLALQQARLPFDPELVAEGGFTVESGRAPAKRLLTLPDRPTAVFCANDEMAVGVMQVVRELGLRIPEDVAVVGFDDIALAALVETPLTTIRQPMYQIGAQAMQMLLTLLAGELLPERQVVLADQLVIRKSCGARATRAWRHGDA